MSKESKHVVNFRKSHLKSGDKIITFADGYIGELMGTGDKTQRHGVLIITNAQAVFYRKGFLGEVLETMPLKKITSIERKSTLGFRTIVMHTSHDELAFKTLEDKAKEQALIDAIELGRETETVNISTPTNPPTDDPIEALKKLGELKAIGVITEEEFQDKKTELMSRI